MLFIVVSNTNVATMKIVIKLLKCSCRKLLFLMLSVFGWKVSRKSMFSLLLKVRIQIYLNDAFLRCVVYSFVSLNLSQFLRVILSYRIMWFLIIKIVSMVSWRTGIKVWVLYEDFLAINDFSVIRLWIIIGNIQTIVIQAVLYLTLVSAG